MWKEKGPRPQYCLKQKKLPYYGYGDFLHVVMPGPAGGTGITYIGYEYPIYQDEYNQYLEYIRTENRANVYPTA